MNDSLLVKHPAFQEPKAMREARVLRAMAVFLGLNDKEIDPATSVKLYKVINTRMLNVMNEVRDAT